MLIGIDIGRKNIICATVSGQIIPARPDSPLKILREDAEAFLGDFVDTCVIALSDEARRRDIESEAKKCGFDEVHFVEPSIAVARQFGGRVLVLNWGANVDISVTEGERVIENVSLPDVGGDEFDKILSEWLLLRVREKNSAETQNFPRFFLSEAEKIKTALSSCESYEWKATTIRRGDFERLIRFHVRRAAHVVESMCERHKPQKIAIHGGGSKIPLVRQTLGELGDVVFCNNDCVAKGAAKFQLPKKAQKKIYNFDEIEVEIKNISSHLTPAQMSNLYSQLSKAKAYQSKKIEETIKKTLDEINVII